MKIIGIIGPMKIEIEHIKKFIQIDNIKEYAGFYFYIGKYKNRNIILTSCSVGKVNAASCTQILINKFNVSYIINTGIGGSLRSDIKLGDIVISNEVTYYDVHPNQMLQCYPYKKTFKANKKLIELSSKACKNVLEKNYNYHIGLIVTGEKFISKNEDKDLIIKRYNPCSVDMESGSIAHICFMNKIPFIIIRSISDNADDKAFSNYNDYEKIAAYNASNIVLEILKLENLFLIKKDK